MLMISDRSPIAEKGKRQAFCGNNTHNRRHIDKSFQCNQDGQTRRQESAKRFTALKEIKNPRIISTAKREITIATPTNPPSSAITERIKSVWGSGR